ncbi:hypothetical protein [Chryseobacterium hagamense]|uniref:Uncharacterized protein n=1 Tax=Chryseobacterium hagamense TaxID=395935 RepID=A0A511YS81_9FLAO|nr:hypothetical protein [Chryseobacterium hagamense]GEN78054.1 hypothetical protein CHA01nite_37940 [Chryseobacterium hagamense]
MQLKIFELNQHLTMLTPLEVMATDMTILNGIVKGEPVYKKGKKISAGYFLDKEQTKLAIEKTFYDKVDKNGFLTGSNILFKWSDIYENPVLTKAVFVAFYIAKSAGIMTKSRRRSINYLQEAGMRLGIKQYIDFLFDYYYSNYQKSGVIKNLVNTFTKNGSAKLQEALRNEENPEVLQVLHRALPDGEKMIDSLLYQIT